MSAWGGHLNGRISLSELEYVGMGVISGQPQYLHPTVAAAWRALQGDFKREGVNLLITEGYRTLELQQHYWNRYQAGGTVAARPGTSNHGWGTAVDMANYLSLPAKTRRPLIEARGFSLDTGDRVGEPWHIEYVGTLTQAGTPGTPITPGIEDDMFDAAAEARMTALIEMNRPLKLIALVDEKGAGGWLWVDREGNWVGVPSPPYADLVAAWGLSQPRPIRAVNQTEFNYMVNHVLKPLTPSAPIARAQQATTLDEATVRSIVSGIAERPVVLTDTQLSVMTEAARAGGEAGVKALRFVTVAQ